MIAAAILLAMTAAPAPCPLTVSFGSYAMGIDRAAAARIETFLKGDPAVAGMDRRPWGREGEYTLCVRLKPRASAAALFERLKPLVPKKGAGPVEIKLAGGKSYRSARP